MALDPGKRSDLEVLNGGAEAAYRDVVFLLASGRAGMAADAGFVVDDKAVLQATGILLCIGKPIRPIRPI